MRRGRVRRRLLFAGCSRAFLVHFLRQIQYLRFTRFGGRSARTLTARWIFCDDFPDGGEDLLHGRLMLGIGHSSAPDAPARCSQEPRIIGQIRKGGVNESVVRQPMSKDKTCRLTKSRQQRSGVVEVEALADT